MLCTYNHVVDGELDATRGDYVNVYGMEGPHYLCELNVCDLLTVAVVVGGFDCSG